MPGESIPSAGSRLGVLERPGSHPRAVIEVLMAVHTSSVRGLAVYRVSVPAQPCRVDVSVCGCVSVRMCMLVNDSWCVQVCVLSVAVQRVQHQRMRRHGSGAGG